MSYVGGPGFELYVPVEMARHVYLALHGGEGLGLDGSASPTPATTRSTRCGSRPAGAPGAPSSGPTRRRSRPGRCSRSSSTSRDDFIGQAALAAARGAAAAQEARHASSLDSPTPSCGAARRCSSTASRPARSLRPAGAPRPALRRPRLSARRGRSAAHAGTPLRSTCGAKRSRRRPGTSWPPAPTC